MDKRIVALKDVRNKLLSLHKVLMDGDRANYEFEFGVLPAGKFLEMLLSDPRFQWLRTLSTLVVRIDETSELDDGMTPEMVDAFFTETGELFDDSDKFLEFKARLADVLSNTPEATELIAGIKKDLTANS